MQMYTDAPCTLFVPQSSVKLVSEKLAGSVAAMVKVTFELMVPIHRERSVLPFQPCSQGEPQARVR